MLNRALISTFLGLVLAGAVLAQQNDAWKKFTSPEGRFSVMVPCTLSISAEDIKTTNGIVKQVYHSCLSGNIGFLLSYSDFPIVSSSKSMLDSFRDGVVGSLKITAAAEKEITLSSHPGREFSVTDNVNGAEVSYRYQIFLVDRRVYGVCLVAKVAGVDPPEGPKFFSSFAIEK